MSTNKQLFIEVMTVIILGSATFLAMSSERPADRVGQSGAITAAAVSAPEQPQAPVREDRFGR